VPVASAILGCEAQWLRKAVNTVGELHGDVMLRVEGADGWLGSLKSAKGRSGSAGGAIVT
jgi:hypothetical protein